MCQGRVFATLSGPSLWMALVSKICFWLQFFHASATTCLPEPRPELYQLIAEVDAQPDIVTSCFCGFCRFRSTQDAIPQDQRQNITMQQVQMPLGITTGVSAASKTGSRRFDAPHFVVDGILWDGFLSLHGV